MKKFLAFQIFSLLLINIVEAQNPPTFGTMDTVKIIAGSGLNQIIIPNVSDGDASNQAITFAGLPADTSFLSYVSYSYNAGDRLAIITIRDKGLKGTTKLSVSATDADGTFSRDIPLVIRGYHNPGIKMSFYDIVFWQNAAPDETVASVFDTIIKQFDGPLNSVNYNNIPLTVGVSAGVGKNQFFTATIRGYLLPPTTGDYKFTFTASDNGDFYLSNDANLANKILRKTDSWDKPDTATAPIHLEAGKIYAIYADLHVINSRELRLQWEGPGIDLQVIQGNYLMPSYDGISPSAPQSLNVLIKAVNDLIVGWTASTDNQRVAGYNVYLDGVKANSSIVTSTSYKITGLIANSTHSIVVQAIDMAGNISQLSNIINVTTYGTDSNPPTPPTSLSTLLATGQAVKIQWSGASDGETQVVGYNLYLSDTLFNISGPIYSDSLIIQGLAPQTTYNLKLESLDAAYNVSAMSVVFHTTTGIFNPLGPDLGEKRGRLKILMNNISWNEGFGLNGNYADGTMYTNAKWSSLVKEFRPGAIRWGAITANSLGFSASTGVGKASTYAKMMNFANSIGSMFALTVGVQDGLDYRTNLRFFTHLMDYLGGPDTLYGGSVRSSEGFSAPLLPKSKGVIIEFGNEVWGAAAHNAQIGADYTIYRQWCRDAAAKIKTSPYYDPKKIITAYSGRNPNPDDSYGLTQTVLTGDTGSVDCLAVSGYLGGNMNYDPNLPMGASELEYYKFRIAQMSRNFDGFIFSMKEMLRLTSSLKTFYLYESNATTPSYNGRLGQAIVMTDFMATSMKYGSIVPTIFTLDGGEWRLVQPENNYKRLPLFITGKYFNTYCKGNVLQSQFESTNKIPDGYGAYLPLDAVSGNVYCKDSLYSVLLCSRDFENDYTVQLDLPNDFNFTAQGTKFIIHGTDFSSYDAIVDSSSVTVSDSMLVNVPKYSMVLLTFIGENRHFTQKSLGNFDRIKPTKVTIVPETDTVLKYNGGKIYFKALVEPANAFSTIATMKLEQNPVNALWLPFGTGGRYYLKGSGTCAGNGDAVIFAYAADDHSVYDRQTVTITNQGVNCPTEVSKIENESDKLIYPNPVQDILHVGKQNGTIHKLSIYDLTGRIIMQEYGQNEINISQLHQGIYLIRIETGQKTFTERFIKQ